MSYIEQCEAEIKMWREKVGVLEAERDRLREALAKKEERTVRFNIGMGETKDIASSVEKWSKEFTKQLLYKHPDTTAVMVEIESLAALAAKEE